MKCMWSFRHKETPNKTFIQTLETTCHFCSCRGGAAQASS